MMKFAELAGRTPGQIVVDGANETRSVSQRSTLARLFPPSPLTKRVVH
jgi:hypothetical protein